MYETYRGAKVLPAGWTTVEISGTPILTWLLCPACSSEIRGVIERECGGVAPEAIAAMCHWNADVDRVQARRTHEHFHFGNPCPYEAMAAVMRGDPDPRGVDLAGS